MPLKSKIIKIKKILLDNKANNLFKSNKIFGYLKYYENNDYSIYRKPYRVKKIIAAYDGYLLCQNKQVLYLYTNFPNRFIKFKFCFNNKKFPGLIDNSSIDLCMFVPYMREVSKSKYVKTIRLVIITDKGQIYHNYPSRNVENEGNTLDEDILNFEESVIWDLPTAKYPSNNKDCDSVERYYPGLPVENYDYHPMLNSDSKFIDKYKNGGFGKKFEFFENGKLVELPRFYIYSRHPEANSFHFIGSTINDCKINILGTYRSNRNVGVRVCLFATTDGGRNWFCKYEFADFGEYNFIQGDETTWGHNYGNCIQNKNYHKDYLKNSLYIRKRNIVLNSEVLFEWGEGVAVNAILNSNTLCLKTEKAHNLKTGNIIAVSSIEKISGSINWIINNSIDEKSNGNNLLFKVKVLDDYVFELRECVSQSTHNICCRHVHHVNRVKDGWLIGTGEIYPNGWILYAQMKEADTFSLKYAFEYMNIYKLNSDKLSVQRTLGMIMSKDNKSIIYASDHDTLELEYNRDLYSLTGEKISHGSTGVYFGEISNINNRNHFKCIYAAKEPCFFFQNLNGVYVFCGQRGELALSFDEGTTWKENRLSNCFMNHYGSCGNIHFFDNYIIMIKK